MMEQIKKYFFNKAVDGAKDHLLSAHKNGRKRLLCVMDVDEGEASTFINVTNKYFKNAGYDIFFLFHWSQLSEKMEGANVHFYSNKSLKWYGGLANLKAYDCLVKDYSLVVYPQSAYRKDFEFVSKIVKADIQVGRVDNLAKYNIDLAMDCQSDALQDFYKQLKAYFPRLYYRSNQLN